MGGQSDAFTLNPGARRGLPPGAPSTGYRAQRVSELFGNPILAQLFAQLAGSAAPGQSNVSGQVFAGPGGSPVFDIGVTPPSFGDIENASPMSAAPAGTGVLIDPIVRMIMDLLRGQESAPGVDKAVAATEVKQPPTPGTEVQNPPEDQNPVILA